MLAFTHWCGGAVIKRFNAKELSIPGLEAAEHGCHSQAAWMLGPGPSYTRAQIDKCGSSGELALLMHCFSEYDSYCYYLYRHDCSYQ